MVQVWRDILRNQLVCGTADPPVQQRLLAEEHLTFKKAAGLALAMETAAKNVETLQRPTTSCNVGAHKSPEQVASRGKRPSEKAVLF